jgi:CRP-like cAMP-binding protein
VQEKERAGSPRENFLLASLSNSDFALIQPWLSAIGLKQGVLLQEVDEPIESVYFPYSGMLSLLAVMTDGTAVELAMVGREGAAGAMAGVGLNRAISRTVVQLPGHGSRISAQHFRNAVGQSNTLKDLIIRHNEGLMAQVQYTAACNSLHTVEARLSRWILQTRDRADGDNIPLTQEFLAEMLGVRRTTVTLVAQTLQKAGLIRYQRGHVEIIDRAALEESSCECYRSIRAMTDQIFRNGNAG